MGNALSRSHRSAIGLDAIQRSQQRAVNKAHAATYALMGYGDLQLKASHPEAYQKAVEELTEAPRAAACKHTDMPAYNLGMCEYCYDNYSEARMEK